MRTPCCHSNEGRRVPHPFLGTWQLAFFWKEEEERRRKRGGGGRSSRHKKGVKMRRENKGREEKGGEGRNKEERGRRSKEEVEQGKMSPYLAHSLTHTCCS